MDYERLIRSLHKLAPPSDADRPSDSQLLERFVVTGDQTGFELLLWRHGPMVLGVCRRLLMDPHDSEDAFQATWLVFVKKAGSIVHQAAVGTWLYQVAYRIALRARTNRAKRDKRERRDPNRLAEAAAEEPAGSAELRRVLDEDVSRLPARQRVAFVLCCVEGRTGEEAARELGCAPGTVSSRLTRARERLRHRLARRGFAPAVGALAGEGWAAPVSETLAETILKATRLFSSGEVAGSVLSAQAVTLAEGVLRAMFVTKLKHGMMLVLMVGVLGTVGVLTHHVLTAAPPQEKAEAPQPPKAVAAPASPKVPKELLEKRLEAAQKVFKENLQRYRAGQGLPSELYGWSERWLEAEMALREKKAGHVAALEAHLARTREVERMAVGYARTGQGRQADADAATYDRLNAEIRLFRATGKIPAPGADIKPAPPSPRKGPAEKGRD